MFKRREKLSWKKRLSGYLWPQGGWKRYGRLILLKLHRLGGTPRPIAAGFACGAAISFTPFVGFHMILAAATAFLLRGNIIASAVGTVVGNPWTFPFIWISVLYTGRLMLGETGAGKIEFAHVFEKSFHALMTLDFSSFGKDVWPVLKPMIAGCVPYYVLVWLVSYYLVKKALDKVSEHRRKNRLRL